VNDLSATERCVKCGLCLPHCPTFNLTGNEADSPRGRISLMQLLDQAECQWSPGMFRHLDQCLQCRACEAMCPSQVPFGPLMDVARERLEQHRHRPLWQRWVQSAGLGLLTSKAGRRLTTLLLGSARLLRLQRLAGLRGLPTGFRRLLQLLPTPRRSGAIREPAAKFADNRARPSAERGPVKLFTGCTGELFDRDTLQATRRLLQHLGYQVLVPARQGCCGALHQHSGQPARARQLAMANLDAFGRGEEPVLTFATGCAAQLLGYQSDDPQAGAFTARVRDIIDFLSGVAENLLHFRPLPETIALYTPCSQRNVLKQPATLRTILQRVPQLQTVDINPEGGCCGAAGSYLLTQPQLSDRLGDKVVERILASGARTVLTTNIGCSLQLRAGLRRRQADVRVMHPVVLLESLLI